MLGVTSNSSFAGHLLLTLAICAAAGVPGGETPVVAGNVNFDVVLSAQHDQSEESLKEIVEMAAESALGG